MSSDHKKLQKEFDELLWQFEKVLKKQGFDNFELSITSDNFIERSLTSKNAFVLREILEECSSSKKKKIKKKHLLAAKVLLKLNKYPETAANLAIHVIQNSSKESLQKLAIEILGEVDSLSKIPPAYTYLVCDGAYRDSDNRCVRQVLNPHNGKYEKHNADGCCP